MKIPKHWTLKYIYSRLKDIAYQRLHPKHPWLTPQANRLIEKYLNKEKKVLEFGAGRSTIWFAEKTKFVVSFEDNLIWFEEVKKRIEKHALSNVKLNFLNQPLHELKIYFKENNEPIFDLILIDGLERDFCAYYSLALLKKGGYLVVDNSNWFIPTGSLSPASVSDFKNETWKMFYNEVKTWKHILTDNEISTTSIWIKP